MHASVTQRFYSLAEIFFDSRDGYTPIRCLGLDGLVEEALVMIISNTYRTAVHRIQFKTVVHETSVDTSTVDATISRHSIADSFIIVGAEIFFVTLSWASGR